MSAERRGEKLIITTTVTGERISIVRKGGELDSMPKWDEKSKKKEQEKRDYSSFSWKLEGGEGGKLYGEERKRKGEKTPVQAHLGKSESVSKKKDDSTIFM